MTTYSPREIESKWQLFWSKEKTFSVKEDPNKKNIGNDVSMVESASLSKVQMKDIDLTSET